MNTNRGTTGTTNKSINAPGAGSDKQHPTTPANANDRLRKGTVENNPKKKDTDTGL